MTKESADDCCKPKICRDCGKEFPRKSCWIVCDECHEKHEQQREKDKYDKAIKCTYEDCPDEHKIMMYSDYYGDNEGYFTDIDELIEHCESKDITIPEYCWSTTEIEMSMDADSLIESACEEMYEDAEDHIDDESRKELQYYLDKWCKEQGIRSYSVDYKYAIEVKL